MSLYEDIKETLVKEKYTWLVTGAGGFIGSNILEELLRLNQKVIGIDNFSTGSQFNIDQALIDSNYEDSSKLFTFVKGDIADQELCRTITKGADFVLHQAALGSVPRSIKNPIASSESNITGFLNMLYASMETNVKQFVYASSSSVYGSNEELPKKENNIGKPLSPYALTKLNNEQFAEVFSRTYNYHAIGLRYFNVFGKRQNIHGPYAAVIPKWITALLQSKKAEIYGDGYTGRDFCYVKNAIQANILAAMCDNEKAKGQVYNVALNDITNLNDLYEMIVEILAKLQSNTIKGKPEYKEFRSGDIKSSRADISKIQSFLGYSPSHKIKEGLEETVKWYLQNTN